MNLSCSDCSQSASDRCSITPPGEEPALLTIMSMRPSALWPCSMKFLQSASLLRSAVMATILRLVSFTISAAAASSGSLRRAQIATSTPSCASARAMPLPIPSLPPVTSAVLPLSLRSISVSSCGPSRTIGSAAGKARRTFFNEGTTALHIVGTGIGRGIEPSGLGKTRRVARKMRLNGYLGGGDRERRVVGDPAGPFRGNALEVRRRHQDGHRAELMGPLRRQPLAGEDQLGRRARAEHAQEALDSARVVAEPE